MKPWQIFTSGTSSKKASTSGRLPQGTLFVQTLATLGKRQRSCCGGHSSCCGEGGRDVKGWSENDSYTSFWQPSQQIEGVGPKLSVPGVDVPRDVGLDRMGGNNRLNLRRPPYPPLVRWFGTLSLKLIENHRSSPSNRTPPRDQKCSN